MVRIHFNLQSLPCHILLPATLTACVCLASEKSRRVAEKMSIRSSDIYPFTVGDHVCVYVCVYEREREICVVNILLLRIQL